VIYIPTIDPLAMQQLLWPSPDPGQIASPGRVYFYREQREVIYSVKDNFETYVVAGNQLGKDFVAAFIVLWWFLSAIKMNLTCRIITTSVKDEHLDVLWGEIGRFLSTSAHPLMAKDGGPLVVNHHEIRRASEVDAKNPLNYLKGQVSLKGEGLAGHHSEASLIVGDEASGLDDVCYSMAQGWMKRALFFGNPNPCENFWKKGVEMGDLAA
jgi:hypothetical protein